MELMWCIWCAEVALFSLTEGKGDEPVPGLKPMTKFVRLLGESIPGEVSRSELSLGMRCGIIRVNRGDDGPAVGRCCAPSGKWVRRGDGVGDVVVMSGVCCRGVVSPAPPGL